MDLAKFHYLEGQFIALRLIEESDAETIFNWRTSPSGRYLNQPSNYSIESQKTWIKSRPSHELNYVISSMDTNLQKVGMISIVDIDEQNKKAEVGRLLLDPRFLNASTPYGLEALRITYDLVLNKWHFNKIYGTILGLNEGMIKLQKFLGMEEEGILKNHLFISEQYCDLHMFGIGAKDLNRKFLPRINMLLKPFGSKTGSMLT